MGAKSGSPTWDDEGATAGMNPRERCGLHVQPASPEWAHHDPDVKALLTWLNLPLTDWPRLVRMVMLATMISASMTAYSTAVGPSSLARKWRIREVTEDMIRNSPAKEGSELMPVARPH